MTIAQSPTTTTSSASESVLPAARPAKMRARGLTAGFGGRDVLRAIDLDVPLHEALAIIGPSGCGKSTFVRCLNRMHELTPGAFFRGVVELDGEDIGARGVDPVAVRRRVGMVFQKPNPFPSMTIAENVTSGLRMTGAPVAADVVERALLQAALWDEVKDRLGDPAGSLSGGQQQRLCIARAIAVEPEVLLMDEPCSALDPIATARIEDLIHTLKQSFTIVIVTHNMQQAARVSDRTAFFLHGELVEEARTSELFTRPVDKRTEDYITGKFG